MTRTKTKKLAQVFWLSMLLIGILLAYLYAPLFVFKVWLKPLPDTVQEQIQDGVNLDVDGMIVYIDQKGKAPQFLAAGYSNREAKEPTNPHSLFKMASISKLYVASAIVKLVGEERLSISDRLTNHFPELKDRIAYADEITLEMMVKHRSGIPNLTDNADFPWDNPPESAEEALEYALDLTADFKPNEDYAYSNTNYLLLSLIIERTVGYDHFQYIKETIIDPIGAKNTYGSIADIDTKDLMGAYFEGYGPDIKNTNYGSMIATAEDIGIFLRALNEGSFFTQKEHALYTSLYEYEHTGEVPGHLSIARYHADIDAVVIQFANRSGGNSWIKMEIVYHRIIKILRKQSEEKEPKKESSLRLDCLFSSGFFGSKTYEKSNVLVQVY
ncbi:MAG: beta-lactamase family protein [Bacteroidia bacterium]